MALTINDQTRPLRAHGSSVGTGLGQSKRRSEDLLTQSQPSGKHKVRLANRHSRKAAEYAKISESRATSPARRAGCLARLLLLKDPTKREPDARCTITSRERSPHGLAPLATFAPPRETSLSSEEGENPYRVRNQRKLPGQVASPTERCSTHRTFLRPFAREL